LRVIIALQSEGGAAMRMVLFHMVV
jgi:hypothetical protein